jgi:ABC-type nickel/cobalt efflux system permease component RcnA
MTVIAHRRVRRRVSLRVLVGRAAAITFSLVVFLGVPARVAAHPLGNFTINHYAGIRIEPERVLLDVVIDQAEIPAFQARLAFDADGDGELSTSETEAGRSSACADLSTDLDLRLDGATLGLDLSEAGLTFPPGAGGLSTMRSVCAFEAAFGAPLQAGSRLDFADRSFAERVGWREIVVEGSGVTLEDGGSTLRASSPSNRLTRYPEDLLTQALADTAVSVLVSPGGPALPALDIPDAFPMVTSGEASEEATPATGEAMAPVSAAVPGGVGAGDLPSIFRTTDLTPLVLLASILTAAALGAGHALTPGHGKTLMAAYLVGTRGTPVHAAGLGLSVALSHTLGILALAALVVGAQGVLPPDVVVRTAPIVAAISIVAIGGWMLFGEARRRLGERGRLDHGHEHHDRHEPDLEHGYAADAHHHEHGHEHEHAHATHAHPHHDEPAAPREHSHGGLTHSHLPAAGSTISWRSLFVLGLAGGLIPSASALLILLGSIAAGRPAFGFVLVVAFGLGMAAVMGGIGLALVLARGKLDRIDTSSWLGRATVHLPLLAACLVLGFGIYLTVQAVSGATVL